MLEFFNANQEIIYFLILSTFLGIELIANVPAILHTPLMSGANAISGVILVGAILLMSRIELSEEISLMDYVNLGLGTVAVFLGTLNISGGFFVTGRMLSMFGGKKKKKND
jgi:H+-translocating NAD(P) transhydrogenase subunit alpha